ncbi:MAG: hypothetical protein C0518_06175 [Opitutus sp.]|nr:hypothetical protein [Opitutus sp.]
MASDRRMNSPVPVDAATVRVRVMVWWTVWVALLLSLTVVYAVLGRGPAAPPAANPFANLIGLVPLFVSIILRWLVLPRYTDGARAFTIFILGLSLAESCGLMGIFSGGPYRDDLFVLGMLGIMQFVPFYARRLSEPKPTGFAPNN